MGTKKYSSYTNKRSKISIVCILMILLLLFMKSTEGTRENESNQRKFDLDSETLQLQEILELETDPTQDYKLQSEKNLTRGLVGATSASQSVVSGTALSSPLTAFTTYTILVTAKDSSGTNVGHGGDMFIAEIYNKCTLDTGNY